MVKKVLAKLGLIVGTAGALVGVAAAPSFAAVDPSVSTAVSGGFSDMQSMIITTLLPALFGLVILGIAIKLAIKFLKRGASA